MKPNYLRATLVLIGIYANVCILCSVLLGSLFIQFVIGEYPCPLCMTQRISFILCALGQLFILSRADDSGSISLADFTMGQGMTLLAAISGASMSIRQVLLHIIPPDPGYGTAFFGLHLYTWAFLIFSCEIIAIAINLLLVPQQGIHVSRISRKATRLIYLVMALVITAFAIGSFIEEGFHWFLPDNPVKNQLFHDLKNI